MYACTSGGPPSLDATSDPGTLLATATSPSPVRVTYSSVDRNWPGRDAYRVCVEDQSGTFGDTRVRDRLAPAIEPLASAANPGLPVVVEAGCPFDYPSRPLIAHTDPSVYSLQIYVRADIPEPASEALEHWLPLGTDDAIPSTLGLTLPSSLVAGDQGALRAVLERYIGREPTHKPGG